MKHERFAELAARELEEIGASLDERTEEQTLEVSRKTRTHELRVAAQVVRDLSEKVSEKEGCRSAAIKRCRPEVRS